MKATSTISLDWQEFAVLEGAASRNFETFCRAIVMRRFQRYGVLSNYRNQAGVEFTLRVNTEGELGSPGRCWGWQCKWYFPLPQSKALSQTRKGEIAEAVAKAEESGEGITDFVLCLPLRPKSGDIQWYQALSTSMTLHLWADEDFEAHLVGAAAEIRSTFFGELVMSLEEVSEAHKSSVAPIRDRWFREVHTTSPVEKKLDRMLLRPGSMPELADQGRRLADLASSLSSVEKLAVDSVEVECLKTLSAEIAKLANRFGLLSGALEEMRLDDFSLGIGGSWTPEVSLSQVRSLGRSLRKVRAKVALDVEAAEIEIVQALRVRDELYKATSASVIAIVGDAGQGKTQLSAEITGADSGHPGIFIRAAHLSAGNGFDDLAKRIPRLGLTTFEDLVRSTDALGQRVGVRIPIVIDGLNESERPSDWKALLQEALPYLEQHPYIALILTMRGAVLEECLPPGFPVLELEWDETTSHRLTDAYFDHYKIERGLVRLPQELFRSPLFLKLYCEATNPSREREVGIEKHPTSLSDVFERYRKTLTSRLQNQPGHPTLPPGHVQKKLANLAQAIWVGGRRTIPYDDAKSLLDESNIDWDHSLLRRLEEEGVLYRDDSFGVSNEQTGILYDAFAGYLVGDSIVSSTAERDWADLFGQQTLWGRISGTGTDRHELANDILFALVALVPRHSFQQQLWMFAPSEARNAALIQTLLLESELLDSDTIHELVPLIREWQQGRGRASPWMRLWEIAGSPKHRLNAGFLHSVLYGQEVVDRDLSWTEWTRNNAILLAEQLQRWTAEWGARTDRSDTDDLRAHSVAWLLTSTNRNLRDNATKALKYYGSPEPARLCKLATILLDTNDPYVSERVMAATYGAVTDHQMPEQASSLAPSLRAFLQQLSDRFLIPNALAPTWNIYIRAYIEGLIEYATKLQPDALPPGLNPLAYKFQQAETPVPVTNELEDAYEADSAMQMDFSNYTLGYLFPDRRNYDFDHLEYSLGAGEVRRRIWDLGWRKERFSSVDSEISERSYSRHEHHGATERYGKKYGWIAYFELAGRRHSQDALRTTAWSTYRGISPDVDPTFPKEPDQLSVQIPSWSSEGSELPTAEWLRAGAVGVPPELLRPKNLDGFDSDFLLIEGHLEHKSESGRKVWGFARTFLVDGEEADSVLEFLSSEEYLGNDLIPRCPSPGDCFAGEMPWSRNFEIAPEDEDSVSAYHDIVETNCGSAVRIEMLAQNYSAAEYASSAGLQTEFSVPSAAICMHSTLRAIPAGLDFVDLHGKIASITRRAPEGWTGELLFIRHDILTAYAHGRKLVQIVWGEREPPFEMFSSRPKWLLETYQRHANLWRKLQIVSLD